jgi:branched-chain amino acid transport system permease protein
MGDGPYGILISQLDMLAAIVAWILVAVLALLFSRTKVGKGLRAVADDTSAALSIGIPLRHIWMLVWATAGFVALAAGMLWGARNGVQFALVELALKALPVMIIGGFTSVPGVVVAGLMVGALESVTEFYLGPLVGGGIDAWTPYALIPMPVAPVDETSGSAGCRRSVIAWSAAGGPRAAR